MSEQPLDTDQVREGDERWAPLPVNDPCSGRSSRDAATSTEHVHDWRADPEGYNLSSPPVQKIVCATCGAGMFRFAERSAVKDWPHA